MKRHKQSGSKFVGFLLNTAPVATNYRVLVAIDPAVEMPILLNQIAVQDVVSKLVPHSERAAPADWPRWYMIAHWRGCASP